jgi:hypothetical protein
MTLRLRLVPLCGSLLLVFASAALAEGEYQQTRDSKTMVWNSTPKPGETSSWAGDRDKENYASGFGDLTWYTANGKVYVRYYGNMVHGKFEGAVNAHTNGRTVHAYFVDGGRVTGWARGRAPSRMNLPEEAIIEKRKAAAEKIAAAQKPKPEPEKIRSIASKSSATPAPVAPAPKPPTVAEEKIALAREKTEKPASVFEPTPIPTKSEIGTQKSEVSGSTESSAPALGPATETTTQPSTQETAPVAERPVQNPEVSSLPPGNRPSPVKSDADVSLSTLLGPPSSLRATSIPETVPDDSVPPGNRPSPAKSDADVSLSALVGPPSSLRATSIPETVPEKTERSISSASSTDKLTEAEAINLADTEARIQGYPVDEYQRPKVDYSAVKGKWALFYGLKRDADARGNPSAFTVTIEDKTKKVEIRK